MTQIHELSGVHEWRYIPTDENPADDCSRGLNPGDLKWKRFLEGPEFLRKDESQWPQTSLQSKEKTGLIPGSAGQPEADIQAIQVVDVPICPRTEPWAMRLVASVQSWPAKLRRVAYLLKAMRALLEWTADYRLTGKKQEVILQDLVPSLSDLQKEETVLVWEI